jgi:hypothetical protein
MKNSYISQLPVSTLRLKAVWYNTGADWLPKFWLEFFPRGPQKNKKNAAKTKMLKMPKMPAEHAEKKKKKNHKGAIAAAQTGNSHELR